VALEENISRISAFLLGKFDLENSGGIREKGEDIILSLIFT